MLILLPKKEVDPGAQNLPDMEIGNEKDAVLIFKPSIINFSVFFWICTSELTHFWLFFLYTLWSFNFYNVFKSTCDDFGRTYAAIN